MDYEWDEAKRQRVLRERLLDFAELASQLLDGRPIIQRMSERHGETRYVTVGLSQGEIYAVVWTWREEKVRIITARRAWNEEERQYRNRFG